MQEVLIPCLSIKISAAEARQILSYIYGEIASRTVIFSSKTGITLGEKFFVEAELEALLNEDLCQS